MRVSAFADAHRDHLESLEINPLLVLERGKGVLALDALMQVRRQGE